MDKQPRFVLRNKGDNLVTEIEQPQKFADLIGHDLFAAFLKCYRGIDQMRTVEALMKLEADNFRDKRLCSARIGTSLAFMMISTCYEMGEALKELRAANVAEMISNPTNWTLLDAMRGDWHHEQSAATFRNQFGAHLGTRSKYRKGLAVKLAEGAETLEFAQGDGTKAHDWTNSLAIDSLFAGNDIQDEGVQEILTRSLNTHPELPELLETLWLDVLETAGIEVVDERD